MKSNLKKLMVGLTIVWLLSSIAYAVTTLMFQMPMKAKIPISVQTYVAGTAWENNTIVDWGNLTAGQTYNKTLDIYNSGNANVTATFLVSNLPTDWSLTYDKNSTIIQPQTWLNGTLTLTVPSDATSGDYEWLCKLKVEG